MWVSAITQQHRVARQWMRGASRAKVDNVTALFARLQQPWLCRYWFAEGVGLAVALLAITVAGWQTSNDVIVVAISVYGGGVGYYGALFGYALYTEPQCLQGGRCNRLVTQGRTLLLELGGAELLDSFCFSPLLLYLCLQLLANHQLAVVVSELISTLLFYVTVLTVQKFIRNEGATSIDIGQNDV